MKRRTFLHHSAAAVAFAPAARYGHVLGANDRINAAVVGINGRGQALIAAIGAADDTRLVAVCDVDERTFDKAAEKAREAADGGAVARVKDYRRLLERSDIDLVAIATPEHWHMPMAMMALKAGKHVYLEKPCSFCPAEGEMLVAAQAKYGKQVQMGNQQRSAPSTREAIERIHGGELGRVYAGEAWYANSRDGIGEEREAPVPAWLDWELWQGPAPREAYAEPWVHYNWHWHRKWGTGEINNNGTHEIDICRYALEVDFPTLVQSAGGRFHFDDAWQWYDTQQANYTYADGKMINWNGYSCNPSPTHGRGRGAVIRGTEGWALIDRGGATFYGMDNEPTWERKEEATGATLNTIGAGPLDFYHMTNLARGINRGEALHAPIADARVSQWHCHAGNIALDLNEVLEIDPATGRPVDNPRAMAKWAREYEPGWEPTV